ncbi:MAG: HEPN domain-containing protein [Candidatus Zapsychrus exili]|nr:HEPN domain-containing protein [Candidatus Zapsychrus exili]
MIAKSKTRDIKRHAYVNFMQKSEECFNAAKKSLKSEEWNATAINAIHSTISACDAMCVYFLGKRHSGENHNEAAVLFKRIKKADDFNTNANRIVRILRMKNMAEYEERLVYKSEAEKIFKDCERFLSFVKSKLLSQ